MGRLSAEEKAERKARLEEKRKARQLAKEQKENEKAVADLTAGVASTSISENSNNNPNGLEGCPIMELDNHSIHHIITFLTSKDLGCFSMTCQHFEQILPEARVPYILSRLNRPNTSLPGAVGFLDLCSNEQEARLIVEQSYGGGSTGRILTKGGGKRLNRTTKEKYQSTNEFIQYARFLDEVSCGYSPLSTGRKDPPLVPPFVNGRFISISPEHSLSRVGGGDKSGGGGSGVASWGVGKRGQLGHGKREDESHPKMLLGGLGYGIRIIQVSAGGGLVRVAHSLLLTSAGRVLSFGTGQYGALGHGYSGGKQLPDVLRPRYIEALAGVRCTSVAAGELHSAAVSVDGDLFTWGDGFCGQLGHADKKPQVLPTQVTAGDFEDECVSNVSCGARHTLAVTEDNEVYSWGLGFFGVLGRSFTPFDHEPVEVIQSLQAELEGGDNVELNVPNLPAQPAAAPPPVADGADFARELAEHLDNLANLSLVDSSDQCIPKLIDSLKGVKIIGTSAGHRHSLFLDEYGGLYSCGAGATGCLGHGDSQNQMLPVRITEFDDQHVRICQMSAGVDMSMAVSTTGNIYSWGKADGGRLGLGYECRNISTPTRAKPIHSEGQPIKAVDVECGYVHAIAVGLNGTVHVTGSVGVNDESDGDTGYGQLTQVKDFNIWHRVKEPKEQVKTERWKKYGTYEVKGRRKNLSEPTTSTY